MCSSFYIKGRRISSQKDLKDAMEREFWIGSYLRELYQLDDNSCLCSVDHRKLADFLQMKVVSDGVDFYFGEDADQELTNNSHARLNYVPQMKIEGVNCDESE